MSNPPLIATINVALSAINTTTNLAILSCRSYFVEVQCKRCCASKYNTYFWSHCCHQLTIYQLSVFDNVDDDSMSAFSNVLDGIDISYYGDKELNELINFVEKPTLQSQRFSWALIKKILDKCTHISKTKVNELILKLFIKCDPNLKDVEQFHEALNKLSLNNLLQLLIASMRLDAECYYLYNLIVKHCNVTDVVRRNANEKMVSLLVTEENLYDPLGNHNLMDPIITDVMADRLSTLDLATLWSNERLGNHRLRWLMKNVRHIPAGAGIVFSTINLQDPTFTADWSKLFIITRPGEVTMRITMIDLVALANTIPPNAVPSAFLFLNRLLQKFPWSEMNDLDGDMISNCKMSMETIITGNAEIETPPESFACAVSYLKTIASTSRDLDFTFSDEMTERIDSFNQTYKGSDSVEYEGRQLIAYISNI